MSAILCAPSSAAATTADLTLERHDISFHCPKPGQVVIEATLANRGELSSVSTIVRFQSAPLGAFVDGRPLAEVFVPAVAPGERRRIAFSVERPRLMTLGDPANIPPGRLLTALGMGEPEPSGDRQLLEPSASDSSQATIGLQTGTLTPDIFELLGRDNPHWAGNLNVFIAQRAVERHLARALRIHPGRTNLAFFIVGSGRDAYCFELRGAGAGWESALYDSTAMPRGTTLLASANPAAAVEEGKWIEVERQSFMLLAIRPPRACEAGKVDVHVTQRSTGRTAVVEFDLDPSAAGPGCFVVE